MQFQHACHYILSQNDSYLHPSSLYQAAINARELVHSLESDAHVSQMIQKMAAGACIYEIGKARH